MRRLLRGPAQTTADALYRKEKYGYRSSIFFYGALMFGTRRLAPFFCLLFILLAACGRNESAERQAFIGFLEAGPLAGSACLLRPLADAEREALGDYARQYDLMLSFQTRMTELVNADLKELDRVANLSSLAKIIGERGRIYTAARTVGELRRDLADELARAEAGLRVLRQPEDLAAVYARAFEKAVRRPGLAAVDAFTAMEALFAAEADLAGFLELNKDGLSIVGSRVDVTHEDLREPLREKTKIMAEQSAALMEAFAGMRRAFGR